MNQTNSKFVRRSYSSFFLLRMSWRTERQWNPFLFAENRNVRSFAFIKTIERNLVDPSSTMERNLERTDAVIILDNYYSGNAIRGSSSTERTAELLAAVSMDQIAYGNLNDMARIQNRTFTARLAGEVAIRRARGEKPLVMSDVYIRSTIQEQDYPCLQYGCL